MQVNDEILDLQYIYISILNKASRPHRSALAVKYRKRTIRWYASDILQQEPDRIIVFLIIDSVLKK